MDLFSGQVPEGLRRTELDSKLKNGEISVREFVRAFAVRTSIVGALHTLSQYQVIEFLFRHLLGRAPATQERLAVQQAPSGRRFEGGCGYYGQ